MKDVISFLTIAVLINAISAGKFDNFQKYFKHSQQESFPLDFLPEYVVGRYVFEIGSNEKGNDTVLYRISSGPKSPPRKGKRPALIQHGIICDANECNINNQQTAVVYLMVDQGYDVWLGTSTAENLLSIETIEKKRLEKFAQYILSTTEQPELLVMGHFNGAVQFFGISANFPPKRPSLIRGLVEAIPGVKRIKEWISHVYNKGRNFLSNRYERVFQRLDNLGRKLDYMTDTQAISNFKNTVFNAWGLVTSNVATTMKIHNLSKMINHPDIHLNTPQLTAKYGYISETHEVQTEDGYILSLHRISGGKRFPPKNDKPVVLLEHGLFASSITWVLAGPCKAFAYILADEGYDVWMGNSRGTSYSRKHVNLQTHEPAYWNFSWHEIGVYDLPASIDRILNVTKQQKLYYVGHSQGTTTFFTMMSEKPEYNDKVHKFAAFAPIVYVSQVHSPLLRLVAKATEPLHSFAEFLDLHAFVPNNALLERIGRYTCETHSFIQVICSNSMFLSVGYDVLQFNYSLVPMILSHLPDGMALKQLVHYGQEVNSKKFQKFDYGRELNLEKYGRREPPEYIISNTKVPVGLFYASNDLISKPENVEELALEVPNVQMYKVLLESFNHLDYIFAIDAPLLIYQPTLAFFNRT